ncbi:hypothetical protein FD754_012899 [Muntiacus muntjak]|uniref:Non-structural maintenance of chromosomes element 4 n=1 Tax=Muntiacus muntjak TaxID=9888 RepID=A0A5N3VFY0_MUNMU|nr:hypothetical protein FD754_012899 [Muntiacus muntjak]
MSGDSNGRRPEGRGRGRDPHRDRTRSRSRSRSRSPLSPGSRRGAAPERREAPERPGLEDTEPSDSGDEMIDPASLEEETDPSLCRQIRHQYRALINSVQQNREDILNASDKLTEVLEEANNLFNGVSRAREAVLDAHFLVLASDLGKEKAKQLRSDLNSFDMLRYVETLLTHMGVNPLEAEELIRDEDSSDFEFIVYDSWKISGKTAENTFNKTHTFHFLLWSQTSMCQGWESWTGQCPLKLSVIQTGMPTEKPFANQALSTPLGNVPYSVAHQSCAERVSGELWSIYHSFLIRKELERKNIPLGLLKTTGQSSSKLSRSSQPRGA